MFAINNVIYTLSYRIVIAFEEYIHNAQGFKIYQGTGISSLSSNLAISSFVIQHEILVRMNKNTFG